MASQPTQEEIDHHIGQKLKFRRIMLKKTLDDVGKLVGVSFQQIQKYELGRNSVSCSRLYHLAKSLGVQPEYFFDGLVLTDIPDHGAHLIDTNDRDLVSLVKHFCGLKEEKIRRKVLDLVKSLSE